MKYPGGSTVISLITGSRVRERGCCYNGSGGWNDALEIVEGAGEQGMLVFSETWKGQGDVFSPGVSKGNECSPANTLILTKSSPLQTFDLQNCNIIHLCCFELFISSNSN